MFKTKKRTNEYFDTLAQESPTSGLPAIPPGGAMTDYTVNTDDGPPETTDRSVGYLCTTEEYSTLLLAFNANASSGLKHTQI